MGDQMTDLNTAKTVAIDKSYRWRLIDENTPRGVKIQLINKSHGVAVYGQYQPGMEWTHWAPLPTFETGK